jgi:undecaprenyl-diphosphatase
LPAQSWRPALAALRDDLSLHARATALDRELSAYLAVPSERRILHIPTLAVAHSGDSPLWLLAAAAVLLWGNTTWQAFGWRTVVATLSAGTVISALKAIFRRPRPPGRGFGLYGHFDRHTFPSGHAGRAACLAMVLAPLLPSWGTVLLALWAGLVGLARIALQVHFASDVLAGWVVGLTVGAGLRMVL